MRTVDHRLERPHHRRQARSVSIAFTVAVALPLAACSAGPEPAASSTGAPTSSAGATGPSPSSTAPTPAPVTPTATATFGASTVEQRMQWFLGQIGTAPVESKLDRYFADSFLSQAGPEQVLTLLGQLRTQAPWTVESVSAQGSSGTASLVSRQGRRYTLTLTVTPAGLIDGAVMNTAAAGTTATTWPALDTRLRAAAAETTVLAAEADPSGRIRVVHRSGATDPQPVSAVAGLYVLAAVAERIGAGTLAWDSAVPGDAVAGLQGGATVREVADAMTSRGDPTAMDRLVRLVGEPAILAAAAHAGNTHPEGITPFVTNRQVAWLAWDPSTEAQKARQEWPGADAARRRALLATMPASAAPTAPTAPSPHWPSKIGSFVTPDDLVAAHLHLQRLAARPATSALRDLLGRNGGIQVPGWTYSSFKGGSDVGVVALTFYAEAGTGATARRQVLVVLGRDPQRSIDNATFVAGATDAANLLSR